MNTDSAVRLQIMGPLRLWRGEAELDHGPRQERSLLAALLAREGRPVSTGDLVDLIWGPDAPVTAVNVIHKYVGSLRRLLEPGLPPRTQGSYLLRHGAGYRFVSGPRTLDLVVFRRHVAAAALLRDEPALDRYLDALRLCQGPAGGGDWPDAAFTGIDGEFLDAAVAATEIAVRAGQPARVLPALRLAAEIGPLNEPVHAGLVTALTAAGRRAEALAVCAAIRRRLADELGIDPGRDLQEAQRAALTPAVARELRVRRLSAHSCPRCRL